MKNTLLQKIIVAYNRYPLLIPLTVFIVWRIALEIVGRTVLSLHPGIVGPWTDNPFPPLWARWDSGWYDSIVRYGYYLRGTGNMANVTFFPLFPLLWKGTALLTPLHGFAAAFFLNNVLTIAGFCIFYLWVQEKWSRQVAIRSVIALALFPASFFFISAYSEAVFFVCVSSTLLFTSRGRWNLAALAAALASAARPLGILLWPLVVWLWATSSRSSRTSVRNLIFVLLVPPLGLVLFSAHLFFVVGDPLAWLMGQSAAGRSLVSPLSLLAAYGMNIVTAGDSWLKHVAEVSALLFVFLLLPTTRKSHPAYAAYAALSMTPSLFTNTLASIQRFVLVIPVLFVALSVQRRWIYITYCIASAFLLGYSVYRFVLFEWAG